MRDIPTSPRIIEIKRIRRVKRIRLIILLTILLVSLTGALSYFSSNPKLVINKIIVIGNSIVDEKNIETHIYDKLSGKYFYLFARSNFLIYPNHKINNDLRESFPRIDTLSVKREGLNTLRITISERTGSYLYCGEVLPEIKDEIGENCYFINNDGYIFDKAPYFSGDVYFKYYIKIKDNTSSPLGLQMLSPEKFHLLARFVDGVAALGFNPSYIVMTPDGMNYLYLKSSGANHNPKILFKEENDLTTILDNLATAMSKKEFKDEINGKYDKLTYIDLKFKNKVLYKFE